MRLKDVKLKTALKLMLAPMGLTYQIDDDVLLITSPQNNTKLIERVYPVGDLILPINRKGKGASGVPVMPGIPQPIQNSPEGEGAPGDGVAGVGSSGGQVDTSALDFTPLLQLITSTVAPGTWRVFDGKGGLMSLGTTPTTGAYGMGAGFGAGGDILGDVEQIPPGSIIPYLLNISLIIRHTPEVHEDIVDLLRQLRKLQDLQVSVEVRFITVTDNFFERIGVDFDFAIQSDQLARKNSFVTLNPAAVPLVPGADAQPVGPYLVSENFDKSLGQRQPVVVGAGPGGPGVETGIPRLTRNLQIPFSQDSFSLTNPFNAVTGAGGSFGIAFLSDLEVYFFLEAAQGDTRSNIAAVPKVTTFNGAYASVFSGRTINYVGQLIPVVNFGAVAFQPVPAQVFDGVFLEVLPVVSADRRYVRLTMAPFFSQIDGFDTFPVPAAVGGGGIGGGSAAITGQIQLPRQNIVQIDTTVTVPDGGTVLLGGVKRLREERQEFGVPILAKTPLINRLFRNVGIGRTTDSLMLMVSPRIIILEEEEERLGIPALAPTTP
jgi:type II secretory pathway component GspD/PulD (secretin)